MWTLGVGTSVRSDAAYRQITLAFVSNLITWLFAILRVSSFDQKWSNKAEKSLLVVVGGLGQSWKSSVPRDCADIQALGKMSSGVYTAYIGDPPRPTQVYCDLTTDGGGWLVGIISVCLTSVLLFIQCTVVVCFSSTYISNCICIRFSSLYLWLTYVHLPEIGCKNLSVYY